MKKTSSPVIKGSNIPTSFLIDYFKEGLTVSDFLSSYPWIKREDVLIRLEELKKEQLPSAYAV